MHKPAQTQEKASLQDVMNMMARRVDGLAPQDQAAPRGGLLTEAEAYAAFDPLLGSLLKEYRDAQGRYEVLMRRHGAADAMVEIAADMTDSADTAVQTRMIELRHCAATRTRAEQWLAEQAARIDAGARHRNSMNDYARQAAGEAQRRREKAQESHFWMMFLVWLLNHAVIEAQRRLSLVQDFAQVTSRDHRAAA